LQHYFKGATGFPRGVTGVSTYASYGYQLYLKLDKDRVDQWPKYLISTVKQAGNSNIKILSEFSFQTLKLYVL
jgi:hypothetical protein